MKVLVLSGRGKPNDLRDKLPADYEFEVLEHPSEEQLIAGVSDVDAIFAGNEPVGEKAIKAAGKLRLIHTPTGYDNIDIEAATRHGVYVANTGVNSSAVAELAIYFMIYLARAMWRYRQSPMDVSRWVPHETAGEVGEKTLGLVGFGRIGREVAQRAIGMNMRVTAYDPFVTEVEMTGRGVGPVTFENILRDSDFISLHAPLTDETRSIIGKRELEMMKPTAYLLNTSRGVLIDEAALISALENGVIAGAGMDVLAKQPPDKDNPLLAMQNVILSPHIGGRTREATARTTALIAENIMRVGRGEVPRNVVNPEVIEEADKRG